MPNGSIVDTRTIVDHGDPAKRFDIVILGEGFQQRSLGLFDKKAQALADRLLAMPPFDGVAHLINVHTVRTISTDSGVSRFTSATDTRKTYYKVTGHFPSPDGPTPKSYLGTERPDIVLSAAGLVAPLETIELCIVLCNVRPMAASAPPINDIIYTGLHQNDAELANYAAHEACHAIGQAAEEYLDGNGPRPHNRKFENQITEAQRVAGQVWWASLARPNELDGAGGFRAVHKLGDTGVHFTSTLHTPVFDAQPSLNGKLGLYWGCQDIDESLPPPSMPAEKLAYEDDRGALFYRSMAACKMRQLTSPFCRVCSHLILKRIHEVAF